MSDLKQFFEENEGGLLHKWEHYFEAYENHLGPWRGKEIVVVEIGVFQGGSLRMWREYFGEKARIIGVDIDPWCKTLEEDGFEIYLGSQSDRNFLRELKKKLPKIDILIDDGGHTMQQQIVTYEEMYDHVKEDGIYLCEDTMTSYWLTFGGGHRRRGTYIEYAKNFVDELHGWHSEQSSLKVTDLTRTAKSVHFYDGIVIIQKGQRVPPKDRYTGKSLRAGGGKKGEAYTSRQSFKYKLLYNANAFLRKLKLKGWIWGR